MLGLETSTSIDHCQPSISLDAMAPTTDSDSTVIRLSQMSRFCTRTRLQIQDQLAEKQ
jgi:hypothetical protein